MHSTVFSQHFKTEHNFSSDVIVGTVLTAISLEETRYYLNGIFLHLTEGHGRSFLTGVATDSHRLSSSSLEIEKADNFSSLILFSLPFLEFFTEIMIVIIMF